MHAPKAAAPNDTHISFLPDAASSAAVIVGSGSPEAAMNIVKPATMNPATARATITHRSRDSFAAGTSGSAHLSPCQ